VLPGGTLDPEFAADGVARVGPAPAGLAALALEPGGKIVAAGAAAAGTESLVARLRPAGGGDPGFGTDGVLRRELPAPGGLDGVAVMPAGRIVAGGRAGAGLHLLALTGGDSSDPEMALSAEGVGDLVTFTATVTNRGADPARDVRVALDPPRGAAAVAASTPAGACPGMVCALGTIPAGGLDRVKLLARTTVPLTAGATVSTSTFDADVANNRATAAGGPGAVFVPDRTRPRVTLSLPARRARALRRRFRVVVGADEPARIAVTARTGRGRSARVAARGRARRSGAGSQALTLRVTAAGRAAIARATRRRAPRRLRLSLTARAVDRYDNVGRTSLRRTLRR